MRLRQVIHAPKGGIKIGGWNLGKVPKKDFPLARSAYGLGASFQWCVINFSALDADFRVLVIFHPAKEKYDAILGAMSAQGLRVICSYQYHAGEPGWHCHAACGDLEAFRRGFSGVRGYVESLQVHGLIGDSILEYQIVPLRFDSPSVSTRFLLRAFCYEKRNMQGVLQ
jgi:hypothetical protein